MSAVLCIVTVMELFCEITPVIRQKGKSQDGGNKKLKHAKFSEKLTSLTPLYARVRVGIRGYEMFVS